MNLTRLLGWGCAVLLCAVFWVVVFHAVAAPGPEKPDPAWCAGSTAGFCNPDRHPELDPIPPDAPPVVKLRHQLAKERREHAAALAACRAGR